MADSPKYQIILLPRQDYWKWVDVIREYAIRSHSAITPSPQNAIDFHRPEQIVTIVNVPNGYPSHGDIATWCNRQAPEVQLDLLNVDIPDQLRIMLDGRSSPTPIIGSASHMSTAKPAPFPAFELVWPTDYPAIVQGFGANPAVFRRWGLPGHDGVDFKAPVNSKVYACAQGVVYAVHDGTRNHPYGIHVRIRHRDGYRTIYAHLNQALVSTGQAVKVGDLVGLADGTGNSSGSVLHLTLKKDGATSTQQTVYPFDIIDPTPYLVPAIGRKSVIVPKGQWAYDHCLVGIAGRPDGPMEAADWAVVRSARIEAIKFTSHASSADIDTAFSLDSAMVVLVQLAANFQRHLVSPAEFVRLAEHDALEAYNHGVRYFEVHNEPNLVPEGFGISWRDGYEFGQWFLQVVGYLKPKLPEAKFGWPGLSPGVKVDGLRSGAAAFLAEASDLLRQADWLGCHCYWQDEAGMLSLDGGLGYKRYRDEWPEKLLFITEFSNTAPTEDAAARGRQYKQYYQLLHGQPGIGAAFAFAVSAASGFDQEVWRDADGRPGPIAAEVGSR